MSAHGLLVVAFVLIVTGFGFKISAVPFHNWAPDVYEGAPTPVTAFMSVGVKAAAFAGFAKFFVVAAHVQTATWADAMIILAVVTMIVGNVLALPQRNLKRMLAYSSIAHAGYLTLGLIAAGKAGNTRRRRRHPVLPRDLRVHEPRRLRRAHLDPRPPPVRLHAGRDGRARPHDAVGGGADGLFMVSLTGIPPTAGFWGKFYLFTAVVQAKLTWLAIVAVIMSAVSAYYYLRIVWYMYFREAPEEQVVEAEPETSQLGVRSRSSCCGLGVLVVGLFPDVLLRAAEGAVRLIGG